MLAHFVAFCNQYPPGVVRPLRLVLSWSRRRAWPCLQQCLPRVGRTRACQSGVHRHVARVASGTWGPAACRGWPPQSVHWPHDHASAPRHQPHTLGMTPAYLWEKSLVPTGDPPCTYGRHPLVPTGDEMRSNALFLQGLPSLDFEEDFKKTTHTTPCVRGMTSTASGGQT